MPYPGEGNSMSNYGGKELSPDAKDNLWKECNRKYRKIHKEHLSTRGNGTDIWPGVKVWTQEEKDNPECYYSKTKKHEHVFNYDRMFHQEEGYNSKLHRDDRQHTVGLDIQAEEHQRSVPVLSSTEYGRHVERPLEERVTCYKRIERVHKGFYKPRGTGIPSSME